MTLSDLLERNGIPFLSEAGHHHCRPGWIQLDCPFCGRDSRRFHLGFNIEKRYFNCWRCGYHSLPKTLRSLGIPQREVLDFLSSHGSPLILPREEEEPPGQLVLPAGVGPLLPPHKRYLISRGFWPEEIERVWRVGGIGIAPRLSWRLFIPILQGGKTVSWTTRAISDDVDLRYVSASDREEISPHKHLVYGIDSCHHTVVVVEGPTDVWRIGPGAGALFGTAFTTAQIRELVRIPRRFICFDSEPAAQEQARKLADQLASFPGVTEIIELDAADPGSATPREIRRLRQYAGLD